ncbi:putative Ca2+/H+ antiporter (TMEM165/GDT1 family) [Actinomadura pelletieri DSM 43383]|uniref:GDT1 family protein n=1 Tax=Actinomadura pelletieri DSM 43383 TaxID=1120940 RepID=A0A495QRD3_9ACTN|nr:TMEM165/GDT1 family protein [Actinomadura pelletieri]RKS76049.1 putative Ca2+/H+ antiporter (TMEM165/GDT1 family) [Actinomadura pelletieri DSM 43383]
MSAFLISLAVIFVAELGDKSQLMAMTFATRFRALPVLVGITAATAIVHLASVAVGAALGAALPTGPITIAAGLAFLGFAAWTLRGDELDDDERAKARRATGSAILAVGGAFFLAELGDKTMLATVTLAADQGGLIALTGVWAGSTLGMVAADALAIGVGHLLGRNLPERIIKYGAAAGFAAFGVLLLVEGFTG